ncbi:MAG: DNA repair protein RecO C-terminal domain-containing protein [Flavobacteriales bacterium]|nr:DNA repair protein RecO C-terminal domain-containing protein [Flavobacteriales bacterium]MCB9167089.1 DNA repair protein RecO C-terminal domain-containing protein [Flavobacteriales bacterium]
MFLETRAIVLRVVPHRDHRAVLRAYTEGSGLRTYIVRTGRRSRQALFGPLERVVLSFEERGDRDLQMLREFRLEKPYLNMSGDMRRTAVLLFLQELLVQMVQEESSDPELYGFLDRSLDRLDRSSDLEHFPLDFLIGISRQMGFGPEPPGPEADHFDLREGVFLGSSAIQHGDSVPPPLALVLAGVLREGGTRPRLSPTERRDLLDILLRYFGLHVPGLGELRSPRVLHQVLS